MGIKEIRQMRGGRRIMGRKNKYTRKMHCSKCKSVIAMIPETNEEVVTKAYQNICNNCVRDLDNAYVLLDESGGKNE